MKARVNDEDFTAENLKPIFTKFLQMTDLSDILNDRYASSMLVQVCHDLSSTVVCFIRNRLFSLPFPSPTPPSFSLLPHFPLNLSLQLDLAVTA